jgi:hypothetical protein
MIEPRFNEDGVYTRALEAAAVPSSILDDLEPLESPDAYRNGYRDAARKFLFVLNTALSFIVGAKNPRTAGYQVAFSTGAACCDGRSMEEVGDVIGCGRAALSKGAKAFCRMSGLPPSGYMKSSPSRTYRDSRLQSIHAANIAAQPKEKRKQNEKTKTHR